MLKIKKAFAYLGIISLSLNIASPIYYSYIYFANSVKAVAAEGVLESSSSENDPEGEILEGIFDIRYDLQNEVDEGEKISQQNLPPQAQCDQDPYCHKIDPGYDKGDYTAPGPIVKFEIKAGRNIIDWTPEGSDHDRAYCWDVDINGAKVDWERLFDNRYCQDPSVIMITWEEGEPPVKEKGSISGYKFEDIDGNGRKNKKDPGVSGFKIFIDENKNGEYDEGELFTITGKIGRYSFKDLPLGTYTVCEVNQSGWIQTYPKAGCHKVKIKKADQEVKNVNFGNHREPEEPEYATIIAHKIVCEDESLLPNWGLGGPDITSTTAQNFVSQSEGQCWFEEGWYFQWGYSDVSNPGDNTGEDRSGNWVTFGPTGSDGKIETTVTELYDHEFLWAREVFKSGYIPFTYGINNSSNIDDFTAEFYCHTDVANYDNFERIDGIEYGGTYYCVAFNVQEVEETSSIGGFKYADYNGNGEFDPETDQPIVGWEISICKYEENLLRGFFSMSLEETCVPHGSTTTNALGRYDFNDLTPGIYKVTEEQRPDTHIVIYPLGGYYDRIDPFDENGDFNFFNQPILVEIEPQLFISKSNNWDGNPLKNGDNVIYTLILEVKDADLTNVVLTDLPPGGFKYVLGSWVAKLNGYNYSLWEPTYASPGVWYLGNLKMGDVVTLTYTANITEDVPAGLHKDLAWAVGGSRSGDVLALATEVGNVGARNFVGTQVEIAVTEPAPPAEVEVKTRTEERTQEVLGAMILPATGAREFSLYAMAALLLSGLVFIAGGIMLKDIKRKKIFTGWLKGALSALGLFMIVTFNYNFDAYADSLFIRLSQPKSPANTTFDLDFVVLDNQNRQVTVQCFKKYQGEAAFTKFGTDIVLPIGGTSGVCKAGDNVLLDDGTYLFKVSAKADDTPEVFSEEVKVVYDTARPGRPLYIEKDKTSDCKYEVTVRTADDGQTSYVEVYRSYEKTFTADSGTLIKTINIGSNKKYTFTDELGGKDCKTPYYAVRAFDKSGNVSSVRAEEVEKVVTTTVTIGPDGRVIGSADGAIEVEGVSVGGDIIEGDVDVVLGGESETEGEEGTEGAGTDEADGDVLGVEESEEGTVSAAGKVARNPWTWTLFVVAIVIGWNVYKRKKLKL
jgi:uncharacterized repeat protein (TIGR01451 family)